MNVVVRHNLFDDGLPVNIFGAATIGMNQYTFLCQLIHNLFKFWAN